MSAFSSASAAADPYENEALTEEQWRQQYYRSLDIPNEQNTTAPVHFRDYNPGEYIHFTRENISPTGDVPWIYGVITGQSVDIDSGGGKRYPFIYYDPNSEEAIITNLDETIMYNQLFHFMNYKPGQPDTYKTIYNATQVNLDPIDPNIYDILRTASLNLDNPLYSRDSSRDSSTGFSRSTTGNSLNFGLQSRSTTGSSFGGKKYRKKKNKTKRRNRKTKRRNNRKTKRR
jgi:hypothetical protein